MLVDGRPVGILHSYIPAKFKLRLDEDYSKSLYRILEKNGVRLKDADQTIEASMSDKGQTRLMGQKNSFPTLVIRRVAYSIKRRGSRVRQRSLSRRSIPLYLSADPLVAADLYPIKCEPASQATDFHQRYIPISPI